MQERPICFGCNEIIEHSPVFDAPCGHPECKSAVFHGLCLMEYYEKRESAPDRFEVVALLVKPWLQEHTENEESA